MKVLGFILKICTLIFLLLETIVYYLLNRLDKTVIFIGKALALIAPMAIYNIIDHMYNITPKLTIYIMGLVNICQNLLSSGIHTLSM